MLVSRDATRRREKFDGASRCVTDDGAARDARPAAEDASRKRREGDVIAAAARRKVGHRHDPGEFRTKSLSCFFSLDSKKDLEL